MISRRAAWILARARSTLVLLEAADVQRRADRILNRAAPRIVFKVKDNALVARRQKRSRLRI